MAITVEERETSQEGQTGSGGYDELSYRVRGTATQSEVKAAVASEAPSSWSGKLRRSIHVKPVFVDVGDLDRCLWEARVRYAYVVRPETGDNVYTFDTGGGTEHITQSLETVRAYSMLGSEHASTDDHKGAIGVDPSGNVQGVDITVPVFNWTERVYMSDNYVTRAYRAKVFELTGRVNRASFRSFPPGSVLFMGASGSARDDEDWEITFRFAASPNRHNLTVGDMTGIEKRGWEYLWVQFAGDVADQGESWERNVMQPIRAYVERVYRYGDFSDLGIGTA